MSAELKPCPFCGCTADTGHKHATDCYFTVQKMLKDSPNGDLSLLPELLDAWNRRAA